MAGLINALPPDETSGETSAYKPDVIDNAAFTNAIKPADVADLNDYSTGIR